MTDSSSQAFAGCMDVVNFLPLMGAKFKDACAPLEEQEDIYYVHKAFKSHESTLASSRL